MTKLQMAAMARADMPEESARTSSLYIDSFKLCYAFDCNDFVRSVEVPLGFDCAHHYLSQVVENGDTQIRDAILEASAPCLCRVLVGGIRIRLKDFHPVFTQPTL